MGDRERETLAVGRPDHVVHLGAFEGDEAG